MSLRKKPSAEALWASLEPLEARKLLSATLSAKGTLVADGTSGNDIIVISRDPKRPTKILLTINGVGAKFPSGSVKRIEMTGDGGADRLTLNDSLGIISARGATLLGGDGNDTLTGGLAAATFDGNNGDDSILGSSKADVIMGSGGNDTLIGGKGDDQEFGGGGADKIYGSSGNDMLYGDAGNDTLFGEGGNDTLGGDGEDRFQFKGFGVPAPLTGNDSLNGGDGDDWITGGDESATLHDSNNGLDTITGGTGNDILDSRGWDTNPDDVITDRQAGDIVPMEDHTRVATAAEIAQGESAYAVHMHATLIIRINDIGTMRQVQLPTGEGDFVDPVLENTGPRFHIHPNEDGILHMHDLDPHVFMLGEFFRGWGITFDGNHIGRYVVGNGHTLTMTVQHGGVNGGHKPKAVANADFDSYVIQGAADPANGDIITITYT
jgi:Ca2+-binding RTX toxin-like protein